MKFTLNKDPERAPYFIINCDEKGAKLNIAEDVNIEIGAVYFEGDPGTEILEQKVTFHHERIFPDSSKATSAVKHIRYSPMQVRKDHALFEHVFKLCKVVKLEFLQEKPLIKRIVLWASSYQGKDFKSPQRIQAEVIDDIAHANADEKIQDFNPDKN